MPHPLLSDPWIAAKIDAAVRKHGKRWSRAQVEHFREQMAWTLATHPKVAPMLEVARPGVIDRSGARDVGASFDVPEEGPAKDTGEGSGAS